MSDKQIIFHRRCSHIGGFTAECREGKEIEASLRAWGLKPRFAFFSTNAIPKKQANIQRCMDALMPLDRKQP